MARPTLETLTPAELAERWNLAEKTLRNWRANGAGPVYVKLGRAVLYPLRAVEAFERRAQARDRVR